MVTNRRRLEDGAEWIAGEVIGSVNKVTHVVLLSLPVRSLCQPKYLFAVKQVRCGVVVEVFIVCCAALRCIVCRKVLQ